MWRSRQWSVRDGYPAHATPPLCGAGWAASLAHPPLAGEIVSPARSVQVSQVPVGAAAITDNT
jgi:hypothetical protein